MNKLSERRISQIFEMFRIFFLLGLLVSPVLSTEETCPSSDNQLVESDSSQLQNHIVQLEEKLAKLESYQKEQEEKLRKEKARQDKKISDINDRQRQAYDAKTRREVLKGIGGFINALCGGNNRNGW